ncbi:MAG: HU family DNA-binding protein [Alloprevotella sp.]|nr:HU family DNA-binding protein [Alloprevotella sp.]
MDNKILLQDIADFLCYRSGITKREAEQFVRAFFEVIQQGLERDQYVKIKGFGTFKLVEVGQRESVNINTGERFQINGHTKVSFTPDTSLKDLVNRPFSHFQTVILNDETAIEELDACTVPEDSEQLNEEVSILESQIPATEGEENTSMINDKEAEANQSESEANQSESEQIISTEIEENEPKQESEETNEPMSKEVVTPISLSEVTTSLSNSEEEKDTTEDSMTKIEDSPSTETDKEQQVVIVPIPLSEPIDTEVSVASDATSSEKSDEESLPTEGGSTDTQCDVASPILPPIPSPEVLASSIPKETAENDNFRSDGADRASSEEVFDSIVAIETEQGMQYLVSQKAMRKLKRWKTISIVLFAILVTFSLFTLSFLSELFTKCDVETNSSFETTPIEDEEQIYAADSSTTDSLHASDTTDVKLITPANVDSIINKKRAASKAPVVAEKTVAEATPALREENRQATKQAALPQVNRGSYKITGTRSTHVVSRGETLTSIAEREYGSKSFANYIAIYNGLKDANYVHAGTTLRLPELQPK